MAAASAVKTSMVSQRTAHGRFQRAIHRRHVQAAEMLGMAAKRRGRGTKAIAPSRLVREWPLRSPWERFPHPARSRPLGTSSLVSAVYSGKGRAASGDWRRPSSGRGRGRAVTPRNEKCLLTATVSRTSIFAGDFFFIFWCYTRSTRGRGRVPSRSCTRLEGRCPRKGLERK
jgi:hypothetical protein